MFLIVELQVLVNNLVMAGALQRAYKLGGAACTCDQIARGNEWYPGRGESPEAIADRRWDTEDHVFEGGGAATSNCLENFERQDFCKQCGNTLETHCHTDSDFYKKYFAPREEQRRADEALFLARDEPSRDLTDEYADLKDAP